MVRLQSEVRANIDPGTCQRRAGEVLTQRSPRRGESQRRVACFGEVLVINDAHWCLETLRKKSLPASINLAQLSRQIGAILDFGANVCGQTLKIAIQYAVNNAR